MDKMNEITQKTKTGWDPLVLARVLILMEVFALALSTAVGSAVEVMIYLTFIGFKPLRSRVLASLNQPLVIMSLVLFAMVGVGITYSAAPLSESMDMWSSWRKFLLVPLVVAVSDDPGWKKRFALVFAGGMTLCALVSFAGYFLDFTIYKYEPGIVANNHVTQAMLFVAALFTCLTWIRFSRETNRPLAFFLWGTAGILMGNLLFVTPGRSGYVALMICMTALVFYGTRGHLRLVFLVVTPLVILGALMVSPVARTKILKGFEETHTYEQDKVETSMGLRVIWWKNTFAILKKWEHPVLGYGTAGFQTAYAEQVAGQTGWQGNPTTDPHNQYLGILIEYGLVGLTLFFLFIASFFRQKVEIPFSYLGIGILLAWCTTSMIAGHFTTFHEGRFLLIWCSVMLAEPGQLNPV